MFVVSIIIFFVYFKNTIHTGMNKKKVNNKILIYENVFNIFYYIVFFLNSIRPLTIPDEYTGINDDKYNGINYDKYNGLIDYASVLRLESFSNIVKNNYEWAKWTKFLFLYEAVIYGSPQRHLNSSETLKKIW